jgi:predicted KAP-like P-loop ATPase
MDFQNLLDDAPVDASGDALERKRFSEHAVRVINRVRLQSESSVIALVGPWGSGKSSVLEMIKDSIDESSIEGQDEDQEWRIADFNPWIHSDPVSMYVGFYSELRACLPGRRRWSEARESLGKWVQTAAPLGKIGGLVRIDASSALEKLAEKIAGDTSASAKKDRAEEALRECGVSILVVMDDLDRLTPDELLEVFKMIRLVGRLPNVYYLLSYDEKTLTDALCRTELAHERPDRARAYLEKIIQIRLDLPILSFTQRSQLVDACLDVVLTNNGISLTESSVNEIAALWHESLSLRLATPRSVRRFFAQVDATYATVSGEVNFVDFLTMTFLRTYEPEVHAGLYDNADELTMRGRYRSSLSNGEEHTETLARWRENLRSWKVAKAHLDGVLAMLATLFLPIKSATQGMEYGREWLDEVARRKGVGHVDYFSRYFFFGVPADDIPDSIIDKALTALSDGHEVKEMRQLEAALKGAPEKTLRKIRHFGDLSNDGNKGLLRMLAATYLAITPDTGIVNAFNQRAVADMAAELYMKEASGELFSTLEGVTKSDSGYCMSVSSLGRMMARANRKNQEGDHSSERFKNILIQIISAKFESLKQRPLSEVDHTLFWTLYDWAKLDSSSVRSFLRSQAEADVWPLLEIIERLVSRGTGSEYRGIVLMGLKVETVELMLGLAYVFEKLATEIDAASTDVIMQGLPDTPANRRSVGLAALSFARHRQQETEGSHETD